jgi:soluble lytic murein transglycosylase-like protein
LQQVTNQAARQDASFIARKSRRSRQFIDALPPWAAATPYNEGDLVQSNDAAWSSGATATSGATAPTVGNAVFFDGVIYWTRQWRLLTGA